MPENRILSSLFSHNPVQSGWILVCSQCPKTKAIAAEGDGNFESLIGTSLVRSDLAIVEGIQLPVILTVVRASAVS